MTRYGKSTIFRPRQSLHQLCVLIFPLMPDLNPNSFVISSLDMAIFPHFGHMCFSSGVFKDGIFRLISFSIKGVRSYKLVIPLDFFPVERIFTLRRSISTNLFRFLWMVLLSWFIRSHSRLIDGYTLASEWCMKEIRLITSTSSVLPIPNLAWFFSSSLGTDVQPAFKMLRPHIAKILSGISTDECSVCLSSISDFKFIHQS